VTESVRPVKGWSGHGEAPVCECGSPMSVWKSTVERPYSYETLSGLKNVYLVGIEVRRCAKCTADEPLIPRVSELNRVIAGDLTRKQGPLTGREIRFLRKHAGLAARHFAELIRVDPSYLSRVETGKLKSLGESADRLARAVILAESSGGEAARKMLLDIARRRQAERQEKKRHKKGGNLLLFTLKGNRWAA
jgi:transcriptional regulator with XRE-family HTH domain